MIAGIARDLKKRRFWTTIVTHTLTGVGAAAVLLGIVDVLWPDKLSEKSGLVTLCVTVGALVYGCGRSWPRPIEQSYTKPNTMIRVIEGDLFEQADENLVIGMTTTFDTETPHVIQEGSIQGQLLSRVYRQDRASLDRDLDEALRHVLSTGSIQKPGKQTTYPVGTVAVIRHHRRHFFCVAYSEMSASNEAQTNMDCIWNSLANLWNAVRTHANGDPVAIPVLGGGLSRISQVLPAQDAIRFIMLSFMLASRHKKVCDRLDIIVRKQDVAHLDMLELQAFLASLRES